MFETVGFFYNNDNNNPQYVRDCRLLLQQRQQQSSICSKLSASFTTTSVSDLSWDLSADPPQKGPWSPGALPEQSALLQTITFGPVLEPLNFLDFLSLRPLAASWRPLAASGGLWQPPGGRLPSSALLPPPPLPPVSRHPPPRLSNTDIIEHHRTSSYIITHHQTSSNKIKHHEA